MKKHPFRSILAAAVMLAAVAVLPACKQGGTTAADTGTPPAATPTASPVKVTPEQVRASARFATTTALAFDKEHARDAAMAYTAADVLNGLATGQTFTPEDVTAKLAAFGGKNPPAYYSLIATGVSAVWANVFPQLPKDGKTAAVYLAALAQGVQDGASPYLTAPLPKP